MLKVCCCIGCSEGDKSCVMKCANSKPMPVMTDAQWADWEAKAKAPEIYDPPQKKGSCDWKSPLRISCPCCIPCLRCCCFTGLGMKQVSIESPDDWFKEMLSRRHPNCPNEWAGLYWMKDNIVAEGLFTLSDADWESPALAHKSVRYNWTVDACNLWGFVLQGWWWQTAGELDFGMSPSGKWVQITMPGENAHFVYVIQPGDVFKRPDGSVVDVTPGEDVLRVSYSGLDPNNSSIIYKYIARRVAYLDETGALVKTKGYDEVLKVAQDTKKACWCPGKLENHIDPYQALTLAKEIAVAAPPPSQETMV